MAKKRILVEFGQGTSLRRQDYTEAARRALRDALWRNSISAAELFDFPKDAMLIDVEIGVQAPEEVDISSLERELPYGRPHIIVRHGGLDVAKPDGRGRTIIANCAVSVSFDMEPAQ